MWSWAWSREGILDAVGKPSLGFKREGLVFSTPEWKAGTRSQLLGGRGVMAGGSQEGDGVNRRHGPLSPFFVTHLCFLPFVVCSSHPLFFLLFSLSLTLPSALPYC